MLSESAMLAVTGKSPGAQAGVVMVHAAYVAVLLGVLAFVLALFVADYVRAVKLRVRRWLYGWQYNRGLRQIEAELSAEFEALARRRKR